MFYTGLTVNNLHEKNPESDSDYSPTVLFRCCPETFKTTSVNYTTTVGEVFFSSRAVGTTVYVYAAPQTNNPYHLHSLQKSLPAYSACSSFKCAKKPGYIYIATL